MKEIIDRASALKAENFVVYPVNKKDKAELPEVAKSFHEAGFQIMATGSTYDMIIKEGIPAEKIKKFTEGRPNTLDIITNGKVHLIINSPIGKDSINDDSYLRKAAIKGRIPYITTMAAAKATAEGISYLKKYGNSEVKSLQELHAEIHDK